MKARLVTHFVLLAAVLLAPSSAHARTLEETRIDPHFELSFAGPFGHIRNFLPARPAPLHLPDGSFYGLGFFDRANGVATTNIVRFTPNGEIDPSFRSALDGIPELVDLGTDGSLLVWRSIATYSNNYSYHHADLVRLLPDGALDHSFSYPEVDITYSSNVQQVQNLPDRRVLILSYSRPNGTSLTRLHADGTHDASFQLAPAASQLRNFHLQPDGSILTLSQTGTNTLTLARYTSEGALDTTYQPPEVSNAFFLRDGSVLAIQTFTNSFHVRRIDPAGNFDAEFAEQIIPNYLAIEAVEHPNGKFTLITFDYNSPYTSYARRLNTAGEIEAEFALPTQERSDGAFQGAFPGGNITGIIALANDELLIRRPSYFYLEGIPPIRLNAQGEIIAHITPVLERIAGPLGAVPLPDGGAFVFGGFSRTGTEPCQGLIRLKPDGSVDPEFHTPGLTGLAGVRSLTVQPDGKLLLIAGHHDYFIAQIGPGGIHRLHNHGSRDRGFGFALNSQSHIRSIHLQPDGKVLIAGAITNHAQVFGLMRLNHDGTIDPSFQPFPGEALWVGMKEGPEAFLITPNYLYSVDASGNFEPIWNTTGFTRDLGAWFLEDGDLFVGPSILSRSSSPYFHRLSERTHYDLDSLIRAPGGFLAFGVIQAPSSTFAQTRSLISLDESARIKRVYSFPIWWDDAEPLCAFPDDSFLALQTLFGPYGSVPILRKFRVAGTIPPSISVSPTGALTITSEDWNTTRIESSTDLVNWTHFHTPSIYSSPPPAAPRDGTNYFFRVVHDSPPAE